MHHNGNQPVDLRDPRSALLAFAADVAELKATNARLASQIDAMHERLTEAALSVPSPPAVSQPPVPPPTGDDVPERPAPIEIGGVSCFTAQAAASRLGRKRQFVYELVSAGRLTRINDGGRRLYVPVDEVEAFLS